MLQSNRLKQALADGKTVHGLLCSLPLPLMVEMIGYAGYDFVILDLEHVGVNPETLENMIRAAECAGITPLVRVPGCLPDAILRALDAGAQGIVVPHVRNRQQAEAIVAASRYHPLGNRGISGGRTTGFGTLNLPTYFARANETIMVVAMIEDREGVERLPEILSVPGIDLLLEGAVDLSQSLGVPGQMHHPEVRAAVELMARQCQAHGVPFCAVPRSPEQLQTWQAKNIQAYLLGDDRGVSFRALKTHLEAMRPVTSSVEKSPMS